MKTYESQLIYADKLSATEFDLMLETKGENGWWFAGWFVSQDSLRARYAIFQRENETN